MSEEVWLQNCLLAMDEFDLQDVLNEIKPQRPRHAALHHAIRRNSYGEVVSLIAQGADIEAPDLQNRRSIHVACSVSDGDKLVKLLLENGARTDSISMDGFSALHVACCSPASKATVELLLAKDTDRKSLLELEMKKKTALVLAVEHGREDLVKILVGHGAKVSTTALEAAERNDTIKALLEKNQATDGSSPDNEEGGKKRCVSPEREYQKKRPRDD